MKEARIFVYGVLLGVLVAAAGYAAIKLRPSLPSVLAPVAGDLAKVKQELLNCQKVKIYEPKAKKKLDLPESIKSDPDKRVVAASPMPPSDYPHTVTAVYDSGTGGIDLFRRQDPLPWLAFNRRGAVGVAYGVRSDATGAVTRLYGRLDLLQIKWLHAGVLGDVDSASGWYAGGFAEVRW